MRIIVHPPNWSSAARSVFEEELLLTSDTASVDIACPYLSIDILNNAVRKPKGFRLLTDVEEWLRAFARPERHRIIDFIARHSSDIRHFRHLHAKVAVSRQRVFFGPANFTKSGAYEREERSASSEDQETVATVCRWFDAPSGRGRS